MGLGREPGAHWAADHCRGDDESTACRRFHLVVDQCLGVVIIAGTDTPAVPPAGRRQAERQAEAGGETATIIDAVGAYVTCRRRSHVGAAAAVVHGRNVWANLKSAEFQLLFVAFFAGTGAVLP